MAKLKLLLVSLIVFSRFSLLSSIPSETVLSATNALLRSGFVAMALTLELVSETLVSETSSATIFCPPDSAFAKSGQPPLSLLQYHISPMVFSVENLRSLPYGYEIPSMFSGRQLIVTTSASYDQISVNSLKIMGPPLYNNRSLIIFGVDDFFDPNFQVPAPIPNPGPDFRCVAAKNSPSPSYGAQPLDEACETLRLRGYSVSASFLDLQLLRSAHNRLTLTLFAPADEAMKLHNINFTDYWLLFLRHSLPCRLQWTDLVNLDNATMLRTFLEGFSLNITQSGETLMMNSVEVTFPDMYYSEWLVVHGLGSVLTLPVRPNQEADSSSEHRSYNTQNVSASNRLKPLFSYLFSHL